MNIIWLCFKQSAVWNLTDLQYGVKLDLEFEVRLWFDNGPLEGFLQGLYMSFSCLTQLGDTHVLSFTPHSLILSLVHLLKAKTDQTSSYWLSTRVSESNTYATRTRYVRAKTSTPSALIMHWHPWPCSFSNPIMVRQWLSTWRKKNNQSGYFCLAAWLWWVNRGLHCHL